MARKYRLIGVNLNRDYRNDLNANFGMIEDDIDQVNNRITDIAQAPELALEAAAKANLAADNANQATGEANTQAQYAKEQGDYAKEQGDYAKAQGDYARDKAIEADEAASLANTEASNLGQMKIDVVEATQNANAEALFANQKGEFADEQAIYAKEQGDYAKTQGEAVQQIIDQGGAVVSVNGKSGEVVLNAEDVGAETPQGAQAKADQAEQNAKDYTDDQIANMGNTGIDDEVISPESTWSSEKIYNDIQTVDQKVVAHEANLATTSQAGHIQLATNAEVTTGTNNTKAVTPASAKVELDKKVNTTLLQDYGYIERSKNISSTDLNILVANGFYTGNNLVNAPNNEFYYVEVIRHGFGESYILQRITGISATNINKTFQRVKNNTEWTPWRPVIDGSIIMTGTGSPEGVITASVGTLYLRTDGGTTTTLYVKTSGTGNTGWTAK